MNVVKWCKKCGIVTWRKISTIVDRSKSVAINHKEIALAAIHPTNNIHFFILLYIAPQQGHCRYVGISSLTY